MIQIKYNQYTNHFRDIQGDKVRGLEKNLNDQFNVMDPLVVIWKPVEKLSKLAMTAMLMQQEAQKLDPPTRTQLNLIEFNGGL